MKKLLSVTLSLALLLLQVVTFYPVKVKANAVTTTKITIDNTAASNKASYIKYSAYPGLGTTLTNVSTGKSWWPLRSEGCAASSSTVFKTLPWLPENNGILSYNYNGNVFKTSGDCGTRYTDGGRSAGAWLPATEYGGWAVAGTLGWGVSVQNSIDTASSAYSANLAAALANNDSADNYPNTQIWGQANMDLPDQSIAMFTRNGNAGYTPSDNWRLFSSGTTLFRNEFTLTQAQIDNLDSVNLYAVADDWLKVFVDGVQIAETVTSDLTTQTRTYNGIGLVNNATIKNTLIAAGPGNHVIAFQVNDKARWVQGTSASNSNRAGLSYKMELNLTETPPATLSCTVTPQGGLSPLVVMVSITNGTGPYTLNMGDATAPLTGRISPVYYTYGTTGGIEKTYSIGVTDTATSKSTTCPAVTVNDPTDSDGGEVAP